MEKTLEREEVRRLAGKKAYYANGDTPEAEQNENFKGKSYFSFACGKAVFNVKEDDEFIQKWDTDEILEVTVDVTDEGAQMLSFRTYTGALKRATFDGQLEIARNPLKYDPRYATSVKALEATADL